MILATGCEPIAPPKCDGMEMFGIGVCTPRFDGADELKPDEWIYVHTAALPHVDNPRYFDGCRFFLTLSCVNGWIFGDANSRQWTQSIYGKKQRFQNPLHQNALHVNALIRLLDLPASYLHNLVFFAGDATLKTDLPANVMTRGLRSFIEAWREEVIAPRDLSRVIEQLEALEAGTNRKTAHREHVLQMKGR